jgi:hypothetical protein
MPNSVTVSIPARWQKGALRIKGFIQHHAEAAGQHLVVNIGGDTTNEIWIFDAGNITQSEYEAADNAIQILNEGLRRVSDGEIDSVLGDSNHL